MASSYRHGPATTIRVRIGGLREESRRRGEKTGQRSTLTFRHPACHYTRRSFLELLAESSEWSAITVRTPTSPPAIVADPGSWSRPHRELWPLCRGRLDRR